MVGFNFATKTAYLCEVTTHIGGLQYGQGNQHTVEKLKAKHERQKSYALKCLTNFEHLVFQFWSPVVPNGFITTELPKFPELKLVINAEYTRRVRQLQELAGEVSYDARNPVFRLLQILANLGGGV